ncbi:hypothetical protein [Fortiea contorta]|uniref:hypothetical protein n=1 Tax=Fortiea contorta TaxID=1892405 RepID=UPI001930AB55|nr:hypothetical protein [Fortiea contorta]
MELDRTPDWREQLIAEIAGRAIGFIQIIDPAREESHYWGDVPENFRCNFSFLSVPCSLFPFL